LASCLDEIKSRGMSIQASPSNTFEEVGAGRLSLMEGKNIVPQIEIGVPVYYRGELDSVLTNLSSEFMKGSDSLSHRRIDNNQTWDRADSPEKGTEYTIARLETNIQQAGVIIS